MDYYPKFKYREKNRQRKMYRLVRFFFATESQSERYKVVENCPCFGVFWISSNNLVNNLETYLACIAS